MSSEYISFCSVFTTPILIGVITLLPIKPYSFLWYINISTETILLKKHFISAFSFVLIGCGVLFKQMSNVKMKHILILGRIFTYIRKHAKWVQRDYRGRKRLLVQRIWTNFSQNVGWNISKVSSRKQKNASFLKHFNGWHQNVKQHSFF